MIGILVQLVIKIATCSFWDREWNSSVNRFLIKDWTERKSQCISKESEDVNAIKLLLTKICILIAKACQE